MNSWTKEQEEAITKFGTNIIVSAGAGSGKTAVLTERTIRKLLNGLDITRLLILTFTNAAAGEMKDRIRKAIKKAGLVNQLDYIDSAYITTFDSFALSVVKKYHMELSIPKDISIMDSSIEEFKTNEIINNIFEEMYGDNDFDKLIGDFCTKNDESIKEIVKSISKKLDLLSNKKDYMDSYIDMHFNDAYIGDKKDQYIKLLFDKIDYIKELYDNLKSMVDDKYLSTYNIEPLLESNTYSEIKSNIALIGSPKKNKNCDDNFRIYKDKITCVLKELKELTRFNSEDEIKESLLLTKPYISAIFKIISKLDCEFSKYKKEKNIYTFSDIALMAIKILKDNKEIREELKNSFDEIMVDEYQDTSDIQEEFINLIGDNNIYMVGDIKQSIYRFRHANPYIFRNKYDEYSNNDGGIKIDLLKNFRSRKEVLNNINLIFNLIMDNEVGDAEYSKSHQMNFGNKSYDELWNTNQNNNMEIYTYNPKELLDYTKDEIEAFKVAYDIKDKVRNKYLIVDKKDKQLRPAKYSDFAIIMDRGTSFDLYKKIFEYVGIPIVQIRNEKLTIGDDLIVIKNLINLIIKVNLNELDDDFKYYYTSVARSYLMNISDEEIFDVTTQNNFSNTELFSMCKDIDIHEISNLELLNYIIDKFNIYEKLITVGNIKESMIKIDYLKKLCVDLSNIGYTVIDFSKYLSEMIECDMIEYSLNSDNDNSVKILNIHKSKGLEYSVCYFTGLSKKVNKDDIKAKFIVDSNYNVITPYINNGIHETILKDILVNEEARNNISEKIRLFYVALTRVKEKIIILLPIENEKDGYTSLVPSSVRLNYSRISDMLESILPVLNPYIIQIDISKLNLTKDYETKKNKNYKNVIENSNEKIIKINNTINYEVINESRYSKNTNKLFSKEEYNSLKEGTKLHYIFETEDFKTSTNKYILNFIKHIDLNYINCFKEYEFIYDDDTDIKHGIIDLILEYDKYINIIDYKTQNIDDDNYLKQLIGYKNYLEKITNKEINIYLYSIVNDELKEVNI